MNVFLTGVAGMLGQGVARKLIARGDIVTGFDIMQISSSIEGLSSVVGDVRDVHHVYEVMAKTGAVETVIHGGGVSGAMVWRDRPESVVSVNVEGTANLLGASRYNEVKRFVLCSSIMVYGATSNSLVGEDHPLAPSNVYGATKVASEALLGSYVSEFGFVGTALRIAHVYGPNRRTFCPVRAIVESAILGKRVSLDLSSESRRQLIFEDDVIQALVSAANREDGEEFLVANVGPGREVTMEQVCKIVEDRVGRPYVEFRAPLVERDYRTGALSIELAKRVLDWEPKVSLDDGIAVLAKAVEQECTKVAG